MFKPDGSELLYKITKPNQKYSRLEDVNGKPAYVHYTGPSTRESHMRTDILLSEKDAAILTPLLKLVSTGRARARIEVKSEDNVGGSTSTPNVKLDVASVSVPERWRELTSKERIAIAEQISGKKLTRADRADKVIEGYLRG